MKRKLTEQEIDQVVEWYTTPGPDGVWTGSTIIAARLGVSDTHIRHILSRRGIPARSLKEAHSGGKVCKPVKNLPPSEGSPPVCLCGCRKPVEWCQRKNQWYKYADGCFRAPQNYQDKDWLFREYVAMQRSSKEIAKLVGVGHSAILYWLRKHSIPVRDASDSKKVVALAGPRNPAWKGGTTPDRQRLYKTDTWLETVKTVFARDGYRCCRCGAGKRGRGGLHAHHIRPWADNELLRFELTNLVTLCRSCHVWVHSNANTAREWLG